jgi:hypothetical protein
MKKKTNSRPPSRRQKLNLPTGTAPADTDYMDAVPNLATQESEERFARDALHRSHHPKGAKKRR